MEGVAGSNPAGLIEEKIMEKPVEWSAFGRLVRWTGWGSGVAGSPPADLTLMQRPDHDVMADPFCCRRFCCGADRPERLLLFHTVPVSCPTRNDRIAWGHRLPQLERSFERAAGLTAPRRVRRAIIQTREGRVPVVNRSLVAAIILVASACGGEPTAPPVATRLVLSVSTLSFDAVGQFETVTATVFDQRGAEMPEAPVTFAVSEGTAALTPTAAAAGAPRSAIIRSLASGVARITATSGGATASLTLTVEQVAVSLTSSLLSARVNEVLFQLPVLLRDRLGAPVAGRVVTFAVTSGGGSVSVSSATTDAEGTARTDWRLGTSTATPQELAVTSGTITARDRKSVV